MMPNMRPTLVALVLIVLVGALACGGDDEESAEFEEADYFAAAAAPAPAAPAALATPVVLAAPAAPAAAAVQKAAPASAPAAMSERGPADADVVFVSQSRIIVWTVDMELVVDDPSSALDRVGALAKDFGGWVVSSQDTERHTTLISVRVPAQRLDEAIERLTGMAEEASVVRNSEDVTDEYVDLNSRLTNMQATEAALLRMLERAEKVEDALQVQFELSRVQEDVERLKGRIKFLEQTSAFSLINVVLRLAPIEMSVDAGDDQTLSLGGVARFRASFIPPEGTDSFTFTWDFGDGSSVVTSDRTAPWTTPGTRVTATVAHHYGDDRDSPYIVSVKISARGEGARAEGEDTLIATVTRAPVLEVFAGEDQTVEEGEEVEFSGSFTRPVGLRDLKVRWDFGDGTEPVTTAVDETSTRTSAVHVYPDHRPFPYDVILTVTGQSDAGEVEASHSIRVQVMESQSWAISGWSPVDTGKTAVRVLSAVGIGVGSLLIFAVIFSPVWGAVLALSIFFYKRSQRGPSGTEPPGGGRSG